MTQRGQKLVTNALAALDYLSRRRGTLWQIHTVVGGSVPHLRRALRRLRDVGAPVVVERVQTTKRGCLMLWRLLRPLEAGEAEVFVAACILPQNRIKPLYRRARIRAEKMR